MENIYRKKGQTLTDKCPYCGKKHLHGTLDGIRTANCETSGEIKKYRIVEY